MNSFYNKNLSRYELADYACKIEMDILKEPSGKQDPFISSYGGLKIIKISKNGNYLKSFFFSFFQGDHSAL